MGWNYDTLITDLWAKYHLANSARSSLNANHTQALIHWNAGDDHEAIYDIIEGMYDTVTYMMNMLAKGFHSWNGSSFSLLDALDRDRACPFITEAPPYELTMADILSTMLSADPTQVEYFVGLVDAYRQSIWNRPFNQEFFAALAQGFMEWA